MFESEKFAVSGLQSGRCFSAIMPRKFCLSVGLMCTNVGFGFLILSINLFALLGSFVTWRTSRRRVPGTSEWFAGFAFYFLSVFVLTALWKTPFASLRIIANVLETSGTIFMYLGYMRYFGQLNRIREGVTVAVMFLTVLVSSVLLLEGKRELYLIVRYSNNMIPILGLMAICLKRFRPKASFDYYLFFVTIFLSCLMIVNIVDNVNVLISGEESFILKKFGSVTFFLGIIIVALLVFSQNQLANARLLGRLEHNLIDLKRTNGDIIGIVSESLELRLSETSNHLKRVSSFTRIILEKIGVPEDEADSISAAAALHDIGKIGIPDSILTSTQRYGEREMEIMQAHTTLGFDILSASKTPLLQLSARIAFEHHENWDGSGYPCGKKGREISLASRVVSVADTFDALVNSRAYKRAWSLDESISYLLTNSGRRFDPEIVAVVSDCRDEFAAILEKSIVLERKNSA